MMYSLESQIIPSDVMMVGPIARIVMQLRRTQIRINLLCLLN